MPVYGGIILNAVMDKCLLVKGWSKNATWGFPKGKVNKNEGEMACAAREVYEEVSFAPLVNAPKFDPDLYMCIDSGWF